MQTTNKRRILSGEIMFVCELKKENDKGIFYRYSMDDNKIWFTQTNWGSIYNVYVSLSKQLKGIELYVHIRESEDYNYYPDYTYIRTMSEHLYDNHNIDEYIEKLEYIKVIKEEIIKVFESAEHKHLKEKF